MSTPQKLFIRTFGCQMNEYDSDKMVEVLDAAHGLSKTDKAEEADIILFNTCSVREKAQEKVFHDLGRVRELKEKNPNLIIGVGGCVASQEGANIVSRAPYVDVVFGPQTLHRLPALIAKRKQTGRPQVDISFPEIEKFDALPPAKVEGASAFVSIMEGCSKYCSFCVVPFTRGEEISRPFDDVLTDVAELAMKGVSEVTLLGQNVNAYRGKMGNTAEIADFATLVETVAHIPGVMRIRYTTSHPREMTARFIDTYAKVPQLVNQIHLPVQSGSDKILAAMKRGYSALEYKSIIRKIRAIRPDMSFSSDFIVGFPGETEADHAATMKLIEEVGFDGSFSFVYSNRPGTPAADLTDDTPQAVKLARLQQLQSVIDAQQLANSKKLLGKIEKVLVTNVSAKSPQDMAARLDNNRVVNFQAGRDLLNHYVDVRITDAYRNSLRGELV
ncbi:MAG: tRNA ((37)-C2)-methylthiotransferase MiaB [Pseudomonadota bacterium]|jgi:tRNA-2-methylthio-N6-dimethylallyladenosine synthase